MTALDELVEYILSLTPDQAQEALVIASDWLAERRDKQQPHPQKDFSKAQTV